MCQLPALSCVIGYKTQVPQTKTAYISEKKRKKSNYVRKVGVLGVPKGVSMLGIISRAKVTVPHIL